MGEKGGTVRGALDGGEAVRGLAERSRFDGCRDGVRTEAYGQGYIGKVINVWHFGGNRGPLLAWALIKK